MTLAKILNNLFYMGKQRYKGFINFYGKQAYLALIGGGLLIVSFGGFWAYKSYLTNREQAAQKGFMDCIAIASRAEENTTLWPQAEQACAMAYETHASSHMAPYFLAYQAQALLKQGKLEPAGALLDKALQGLIGTQFYPLFKTRRALIRFDSADKNEQAKGLAELKELAFDAKNMQRDMALYYLGQYYWSIDDREQARKAWQELQAFGAGDKGKASPWAALVKANLEQLAD